MTGILLIVAAAFGTESAPVLTQEILLELDAIATFTHEDLLLVGSEVRHVAAEGIDYPAEIGKHATHAKRLDS